MNQIAVSRVDLNSVKTGFFRVQSGDAEILYQLPDLTDGQLPRDFLIPGTGDRGTGNGLHAAVDLAVGLAARVVNLAENPGTVLMNGVGEPSVAGNLLLLPQSCHGRIAGGMFVNPIIFGYN